MTKDNGDCSPGSHPHSDRPNWRLAENIDDYLANCREGLETYSDRRAAKLLGLTRAEVQRAKLFAEIPGELFERLLVEKTRPASPNELAYIARALRGGQFHEVERCPHCAGVLRVRQRINKRAVAIVNGWLAEGGTT